MSNKFWSLNQPVEGEKHTPIITISGEVTPGAVVDVTVDMATRNHPNENAHHIQWIELRANDLFIARAEFTPKITQPVVTFKVIVPKAGKITLTAIERCNVDGLWISEPVILGC